jgi:hypothetical protein
MLPSSQPRAQHVENVHLHTQFGQAPMLVTPCKPGKGCKQLLIVGQKVNTTWQ